MNKCHKIGRITFVKEKLILKVDGRRYALTLADISERLADATRAERESYEVSPSGYGIHWPLIDEDLSVDGLIGVKHRGTRPRESISA